MSEAHDTLLELSIHSTWETAKEVKNKIVNTVNNDFFEVAQLHLNTVKKRKKFSQLNTDHGSIEIFKLFLGKSCLSFNDLNVSLLKKFQSYLLHSKGNAPRTVMNYFILFRTIYNLALAESITDRKGYPFGKGKIQIKFPESEKIGLSKYDVRSLENAQALTDAQQHALDVWLLSLYFAGVRMSDVIQLKWKDLKDDRLYYRMGKNEKLVSLKIPLKAQALLEKYEHHKNDNNGV